MVTKKKTGKTKQRRLGRGLTSLISTPVEVETTSEEIPGIKQNTPALATSHDVNTPLESHTRPDDSHKIVMLRVGDILPRPGQPRQHFDEETLRQLAESIRSAGLMQPILVRRGKGDQKYEIISGERRWRAAEMINLETIPAILREVDDERTAEWSLIENIQREDLNPIERAEAFMRLINEYGMTHQELAARLGLDRTNITNPLRLNELDSFCKGAIRDGRLTMGHGKVLLGITNNEVRRSLAENSVRSGWSVRETERRARNIKSSPEKLASTTRNMPLSPQLENLQRRLGEHLGTKVKIIPGRKSGSGKLVIDFFDIDHFEGIMRLLQFESE